MMLRHYIKGWEWDGMECIQERRKCESKLSWLVDVDAPTNKRKWYGHIEKIAIAKEIFSFL